MRNYNEKSRESYNKLADHYDSSFEGRFTLDFKNLLLEEITAEPGARVLDIACGNGTLLSLLAGKFGIAGFGADISEKMIENARLKYPEMIFETAGCEKLPFDDRSFDILTVCAAYHHFPDVKSFAAEAYRLLKTGGCLYIADVYYPDLIRLILNPFVPMSKAGDVKFYAPKDIIKRMEKAGFRHVRLVIRGHIQVIVFQKC
jgi:ubiquinone/menaquinone biosynthesis C-methylase UbiE